MAPLSMNPPFATIENLVTRYSKTIRSLFKTKCMNPFFPHQAHQTTSNNLKRQPFPRFLACPVSTNKQWCAKGTADFVATGPSSRRASLAQSCAPDAGDDKVRPSKVTAGAPMTIRPTSQRLVSESGICLVSGWSVRRWVEKSFHGLVALQKMFCCGVG